ncbi:protein TIC 20-I, chloroplastic-like isoform X2 [Phragmites australis]|nr:protein TIC 20-I, chloroplastic-like isoform X2 [Phragmites australis]
MSPGQGVATANARPYGIPAVSCYSSPACPSFHARPAFLSLQGPAFRREKKSFALRAGIDFPSHAIISSFTKYEPVKGIKPLLSSCNSHSRTQVCCQASLSSFSYPELSSKPKWWWRTLACVPYLLPLHNMWSHADTIYQLHPYLQRFGLLYAFIDTMALLPGWLFLVIFMTIYFFVVRRKWSPHFLRFHIILAILLDTGSQAMATACNWNPSIVFQGKPMAYFWMTMAFIQIFTVLECMRCALSGVYPNVPFMSHSAFIHSDLNLFR